MRLFQYGETIAIKIVSSFFIQQKQNDSADPDEVDYILKPVNL